MEILDGMRKRLKRRNILLDEVRKAYLSDLVASNAPIKKRASAINLQPMLALYAPSECTYELIQGRALTMVAMLKLSTANQNMSQTFQKR